MGVEGVGVLVGIDDWALSGVRLAEDRCGEERRGRSKRKRLFQGLWVFSMALLNPSMPIASHTQLYCAYYNLKLFLVTISTPVATWRVEGWPAIRDQDARCPTYDRAPHLAVASFLAPTSAL
jgi:hypothetical protein